MKFNDLRVKEEETYELGDIIKGQSGTHYIICKANSGNGKYGKFGLFDLTENRIYTGGHDTILEAVNYILRDKDRTHIKSDKVEVTFR